MKTFTIANMHTKYVCVHNWQVLNKTTSGSGMLTESCDHFPFGTTLMPFYLASFPGSPCKRTWEQGYLSLVLDA